jgi:hypothetical protein
MRIGSHEGHQVIWLAIGMRFCLLELYDAMPDRYGIVGFVVAGGWALNVRMPV